MIEQNLLANDLIKMTDLEELNGAFYEIDAQGVLDIWESMTSEVRVPDLHLWSHRNSRFYLFALLCINLFLQRQEKLFAFHYF